MVVLQRITGLTAISATWTGDQSSCCMHPTFFGFCYSCKIREIGDFKSMYFIISFFPFLY
uniref:Small nuclear ribonucleoprotein-associated protein n=1 Tax=Solanum tuberosum TaxID=4113 RepID=M0ZGT4_SOLTU